jgi:hypothetical protein
MSNAMRCASVLNRNQGGKWKYTTDTTDTTDITDTTSIIVGEEIIYDLINILTAKSDTLSGIDSNVIGRIISNTSYNTQTKYEYLLDKNSQVSHSSSPTGNTDIMIYLDNSNNLIMKSSTKYLNYYLDFIFIDISLNTDAVELCLTSTGHDEHLNYIMINTGSYYVIFGKYYDITSHDSENIYYKLSTEPLTIGKIQAKSVAEPEPEPEPEPEAIIEQLYIFATTARECGFNQNELINSLGLVSVLDDDGTIVYYPINSYITIEPEPEPEPE